MKMEDWISILDSFLKINRYGILEKTGIISHTKALLKAEKEFEKFRKFQDQNFISDFDKEIKKMKRK